MVMCGKKLRSCVICGMSEERGRFFTSAIVKWHTTENYRDLPWKGETDPYKIWLSEVILQQTRALQGLPYYMKFIETYPTVFDMAQANEEDVFRLWQGLGYYNRCKNMLATAKIVVAQYSGCFPDSYEGLLGLKGIGPYTAAAIGSFAYGLPCAVVDGNVYRVLSRYLGIDTPIDSTMGKKVFAEWADKLLDKANSKAWNQAIMDLGATVCTPATPKCGLCPLEAKCASAGTELVRVLPVKEKKVKVRERHFNFVLLLHDGDVWLEKRTAGDIWENLFQPYLIETEVKMEQTVLLSDELFEKYNLEVNKLAYVGATKQRLTHQLLHSRFYVLELSDKIALKKANGNWYSVKEIKNLAFPQTLVSFFKNNLYF